MFKKEKGFTLIELLVVVAIIAVLSSVVMAMVGSAKKRGIDSAIKTELSSLRSEAEIYALNNGNSYNNLFTGNNSWASTDPKVQEILTYTDELTSVHTAGSSSNQWAAQAQLKQDPTQYVCIDYTTEMTIETNVLTAGSVVCP